MMTMREKTLQLVMTDTAVETTLTQVATMVGLTRERVAQIVAAGLPMMANAADAEPVVFQAMYAESLQSSQEPAARFTLAPEKPVTTRQARATAFTVMFGSLTESINRDAAAEAGATPVQAGQVLAATMPVVVRALGLANTNLDELGFGRQLRNLNA
jgi:hypothetical protein